MTWAATILTIQPEMFPGPLGISLCGKALSEQKWSLQLRDIREHSTNRYGSVDDTPAGGGPGMVMRADIMASAIDAVERNQRPLILLSPRGQPFTQARARDLAQVNGAVFICGRFEGVDQRVIEARQLEEISIGDYVLSGGELATMIIIDAVVRLLPGGGRRKRVSRRRKLRARPAGVSALHTASDLGRKRNSRHAHLRPSQKYSRLASRAKS